MTMKTPLHTLLEISTHILKEHPELIPHFEEAIVQGIRPANCIYR
jgi:hypothetical protein